MGHVGLKLRPAYIRKLVTAGYMDRQIAEHLGYAREWIARIRSSLGLVSAWKSRMADWDAVGPRLDALLQGRTTLVEAARILQVDYGGLKAFVRRTGRTFGSCYHDCAEKKSRVWALLSQGKSKSETAKLTGVPYASVLKYAEQMPKKWKSYVIHRGKKNEQE